MWALTKWLLANALIKLISPANTTAAVSRAKSLALSPASSLLAPREKKNKNKKIR